MFGVCLVRVSVTLRVYVGVFDVCIGLNVCSILIVCVACLRLVRLMCLVFVSVLVF